MKKSNQQGFVLVFVIAVITALSLMTAAMNFYYDSALKSVTRNSVYQQVKLASETGIQSGKNWILNQLNQDRFSLLDIQNNFKVENSNNECLNRHGYTDKTKDVLFSKRINGNLGQSDAKFEDISYEVFIQRYADVIKSIYFSGTGSPGTSLDRSAAYIRSFRDFPSNQFTVEMWLKNMHADDDTYNMHAWEWGRTWDVVFKVWRQNIINPHSFSPRIGNVELSSTGGQSSGESVRREWTHIAWVWDGGSESGNVRIYQNGNLTGTWNASVPANYSTSYGINNSANQLANTDVLPLAIGEGTSGFSGTDTLQTAETGSVNFQGVPWLGNIVEARFWNISRTQNNIVSNFRTRLTGSEPGLVSYYKFNEGEGSVVTDFNTSRAADRRNNLTVLGLNLPEGQRTEWRTEVAHYPLEVNTGANPMINVPPGEDIAYYRILSCGRSANGQLIPLETVVSAPVVQGDVGDGMIAFTTNDISFNSLSTTPDRVEFNFFNDGSDSSIYMNGEDSIAINDIPTGWSVTQNFSNNITPLTLTPPPAGTLTLDDLKNALARVFYLNCSKNFNCAEIPESYTPGIRKIRVKLVYTTNAALNREVNFTKLLSAREKVVLTPINLQVK